jgi:hypothetical protein
MVTNLYNAKLPTETDVGPNSSLLIEEIAEYEAFLTIIRTIERARERKKLLIDVLDDTNALLVGQLPFGDDFVPIDLNLSKPAKTHLDWLLANLDRTNHVLRAAMSHLRTLYGGAYQIMSYVFAFCHIF